MSKLDDVEYVDTLQLQTASGETEPVIYANGLHQVAIQVIVKAITKDDKPLKSIEELRKGLFLCYADDGNKLNWNGSKGWTYTDVEGEYNGERQRRSMIAGPTTSSIGDDGTAFFKWFVSSTYAETKRISVGLRTSTKLFTTADNSSGAERLSVKIEASPAINYSHRNNLEIQLGAFLPLASNLRWIYAYLGGSHKEYSNGTSRKRIAYIHPAPRTNQTKFKSFRIDYTPVYTEDHHVLSNSANYIELVTTGNTYPCAVVGRSQENKNYQILAAFARKNHVQLYGSAYVNSPPSGRVDAVTFDPITDDNDLGIDEGGIPSLSLYQFSYPIGEKTEKYYWKTVVHETTVKLTDFYGNTGSVKLIFDDEDHFDGPGIM